MAVVLTRSGRPVDLAKASAADLAELRAEFAPVEGELARRERKQARRLRKSAGGSDLLPDVVKGLRAAADERDRLAEVLEAEGRRRSRVSKADLAKAAEYEAKAARPDLDATLAAGYRLKARNLREGIV